MRLVLLSDHVEDRSAALCASGGGSPAWELAEVGAAQLVQSTRLVSVDSGLGC